MRFPIGSLVRVRDDAPGHFRPGEPGIVRRVRAIDRDSLARALGASIGSELVLLELADGTALEIPEHHLDRDANA